MMEYKMSNSNCTPRVTLVTREAFYDSWHVYLKSFLMSECLTKNMVSSQVIVRVEYDSTDHRSILLFNDK